MKNTGKMFYGWKLIIILWICYFSNVGFILYGSSVLAANMVPDMGFSIAVIGVAVAACNITQGISGPFVGFFISKKGAKIPFAAGCVVIAAGAILIPLIAKTETSYVILYGILIGFGMSLASMNVTQAFMDAWFEKKKALAMSLVLTAGSVGGFCAPLIMNAVIGAANWQTGWTVIGVCCAVGTILTITLVKRYPSDIGEVPDGKNYKPSEVVQKSVKTAKMADATKITMPFSRVVKSYVFWGCIINYMTRAACYYTLVGYIVVYFTQEGVAQGLAVLALSVFSVGSLLGRIFIGAILDVFIKARYSMLLSNIILFAGMMIVAFLGPVSSFFVILAPLVAGFGHGIGLAGLPTTVSRFFGTKNFPLANGIINSTAYLVGSYGPLFTGFLAAATGNFTTPFAIVGLIGLAGGLLSLIGKYPKSDYVEGSEAKAETEVTTNG
ncbi:MFS transporter [Clostridia bacterium]|nr:MFS transporter [Clostridia bacterium]